MGQKREAVLCFAWIHSGQPKIVVAYQDRYKRLGDRLDRDPEAEPPLDLRLEKAVLQPQVFVLERQLPTQQPRHSCDQRESCPVEPHASVV